MKRELRKALTGAFATMRANGYFASHNFSCCNSCSWDEIPWSHADHAVFYNDQDKASADIDGVVLLTWQGDPAYIRAALEYEGLVVDHDGSVATRIRVSLP